MKNDIIRPILMTLMLPFILMGCNTIEGAGTDIKETGKSIERAAGDSKEKCYPCPPSRSRPVYN